MAIHEDVPGLEVTVRCNERPLHELEDPDATDNDDAAASPMACKYIECVDDAEFDVAITVTNDYEWGYRNHVLVATVYVDGKHIRGSVIRSPETQYGVPVTRLVKGQEVVATGYTNLWSLRKFRFATVKTIDDALKERVESDLKIAKSLGTIEIKFTRAIEYGPTSSRGASDVKSGNFELAEKSLKGKAVSHGTTYGICEAIAPPRWLDVRDILEDKGPIAIFKFMYRSRDALKRELIIPRSPSHSPALEGLTPAQRDRLARERLEELRNKKVKGEDRNSLIKREFGEVFDLTQDAPAPAPRPTKKSRVDGKEVDVIDLTDD
ncbi:hypothetical protein HD806DRAFT_72446 [Xylariaceae sp. AK1471]|nr:hypothetical protein HD806DRAFT_72446 [Xylariaceae sp. AK1471]